MGGHNGKRTWLWALVILAVALAGTADALWPAVRARVPAFILAPTPGPSAPRPAVSSGTTFLSGPGASRGEGLIAPPAAAAPVPMPPATPPVVTAAPRPARAQALEGPARVVDRGNPARRAVALTFDAGADRGYAEYILDVLKEQGVRATFGMTGVWAERNPDLVQRMAAEGHRLMNHSYDHSSFTGRSTGRRPLTTEERWAQLDRTEQVIVELTGQSTRPLFRAPYGDTDASVLRDIAARGYAYNVLWTVDSRGWMHYSAGAIVERCLRLAEPGAIYVMHVGGESLDALALPAVIAGLRAAGYEFETVDEIIE